MSTLRRDPSPLELLDRIARLEKGLASAESRARRWEQYVDHLFEERDKSLKLHEAQYNRVVAVIERLTMLEDKVFPNMGPMLQRVESAVGSFDKWHMNNPLDHRKKEPGG